MPLLVIALSDKLADVALGWPYQPQNRHALATTDKYRLEKQTFGKA